MMSAPVDDVVEERGDELKPDPHIRELIEHYISEFKDRGCLEVVVRMLRQVLPEHMYPFLITAIDKEGSILNVIFNALKFYLIAVYSPAAAMATPQPAPVAAPQQAPGGPSDIQQMVVQKAVEKALEKAFSDDSSSRGGGGMLGGLFGKLMEAMLAQTMSRMIPGMGMPMMPGMPAVSGMPATVPTQQPQQKMIQIPVQSPQQTQQQQQQTKKQDVEYEDVV